MTRLFTLLLIVYTLAFCSHRGNLNIKDVNKSGDLGSGIQFKIEPDTIKIFNDKYIFIEFPTDKAFLSAGKGEPEVKYNMAAFKFKDKKKLRCKNQDITGIEAKGPLLKITGTLSGSDCNTGYEILFKNVDKQTLEFEVTLSDKSLNRIHLLYKSDEKEAFFGFGEQYTHFNMKGKTPFIFTEEQGIGRGDQPITFGANLTAGAGGNEYTSYAPIPHYITTNNRSVFFENSSYARFNLKRDDLVRVQFWENNLKGTIWTAGSPLELIELYTKKTGRYPELPNWAYGTWLGLQGGKEKVTKVVDEAIKAGNPISALWIQDWVGRRVTNFGDQLKWRWYAQETSEFTDSEGKPEPSYPDFKKFTQEMDKKGVKVLGYINSFLADTNPKIKDDPFRNPMLEEAKKKGYLVKNQKGEDYLIETVGFPAYLIDFTNPEAYKWTKEIIKKNMIDVGLAGWMADFGEWLPFDAKLYSGVSAETYHNQYPVDWAKLNREAIAEAKKEGQIIFFTRAGYSYSSKYSTAFWLGDQMVSFGMNDGLASTIVGLNSGGISGIAINHSDIGGYTGLKKVPFYFPAYDRERELTQRWSEMNAFIPIFRTHEGNVPKRFHQVYSDTDSINEFARYGKIHFALKDYFAALVKEAKEKGYPIIRHPYLHYPEDANVREIKYQFMVGEDLLVLPVYKKGKDEISGYFPKGKWKHVLTGEVLDGGRNHTVKAPIGQPAAFVKVGGKWSDKIFTSIQAVK